MRKYRFTKKRKAALCKARRKWKNMSPKKRKAVMPNKKRKR